jgi:Holliday junction resolvasome RuvABC ATP-dependent DNA helicase subunit
MNSIPFYRDFGVAGELTRRPRGEPGPARRGLLRRVVDAIERSHQRAVERDIARVARDLGLGNPGGRLTDEIERRLFQHLTGDRGFRP